MRRAPSPRKPVVVAPDPDARSVRAGWTIWACGIAIVALTATQSSLERLPLLALPSALLLLWPLWRGGRRLWSVLRAAPHEPWQGSYFEFDGQQIRILVDDTDALWICAADVFDALRLEGRARDPERVRVAAGRDGLRQAPGAGWLGFTERGLAAWLERRVDRQASAFRRWLQSQVLGPHRRRLELAGTPRHAPGSIGAASADPEQR